MDILQLLRSRRQRLLDRIDEELEQCLVDAEQFAKDLAGFIEKRKERRKKNAELMAADCAPEQAAVQAGYEDRDGILTLLPAAQTTVATLLSELAIVDAFIEAAEDALEVCQNQ